MDLVALEVLAVVLLILANGALAMAEFAIVSARKGRLQQRADEGDRGAKKALELAADTNRFLSTIQAGVTLIGTLTGAFSGVTLARQLTVALQRSPQIAPYAESIAVTCVVLVVAFLTLILGELVPKNLALAYPERLASALAPATAAISRVFSPVVRALSWSTSVVLKSLPVSNEPEPPVTEEEIKDLVAEGARHGTVEEAEQEMVEGVFRLGDRMVGELMKPANRVAWLDAESSPEQQRELISGTVHSRLPVARGSLDQILGVVHLRDLLARMIRDGSLDFQSCLRKPLVFPETKPALDALEAFQQAGSRFALVVDEHGATAGIITTTDIIQAVVGDLHRAGEPPSPSAVQREDGSWLVDGMLHFDDLKERLDMRDLPEEEESGFSTVGGLAMKALGRVPAPADHFDVPGWRFEVVDMDGSRVDKVLVTRVDSSVAAGKQ